MIAVDTNLLVRLLTNDDPVQAKRAAVTMQNDDILIPKTVILELEWVLRHAYGIDNAVIMSGLQKLLGLPNVIAENQQAVCQAIAWCTFGLDFADALHLSSSEKADRFVTFDNSFIKKARGVAASVVTQPS